MPKLTVGAKMPDLTFCTPYANGCSLSQIVRRVKGKTALVFLRYYGCTLCQYDIHLYKEGYEKIAATGGQLLVVLQSDPGKLAVQLEGQNLPFEIICDPREAIYKELEIAPAETLEAAIDQATQVKMTEMRNSGLGLKHGEYEGNEEQLPATFVVDRDLVVTYADYPDTIGAVPSPEELAKLMA